MNKLCDTSVGMDRLIIPGHDRLSIMNKLYKLSHLCVQAAIILIEERFYYLNMNKSLRWWVRHQCSLTSSLRTHPYRLAGSLRDPHRYSYLMASVNCFTRWVWSVLRKDATAEKVAHAFIKQWVTNLQHNTSTYREVLRSFVFYHECGSKLSLEAAYKFSALSLTCFHTTSVTWWLHPVKCVRNVNFYMHPLKGPIKLFTSNPSTIPSVGTELMTTSASTV